MSDAIAEALDEAPPTGFARKSAISFLGQVVVFVCNFAVGILIARLLGAEGKGAYALISSTAVLGSSLLAVGMPTSVTFFVGRHKWPPLRALLLGGASSLVLSAIVLAAILIIGPERLFRRAAWTPEIIRLTWVMLTIGVPLQIVGSLVWSALRGRELIVESVWPGIVTSIVRTALVACVLILVCREVVGVVFADLAVGALGLFLVGLVLRSALRTWPRSPGKPSLGRLVSYGLQLQAGSILFMLWLRADLYLVNYFLGQGPAGLYSVAMPLAELASFPAVAIMSVLFPRLALSAASDRSERTMRSHRAVAALSLPMSLLLAGVAFLIPAIYGQSFAPAVVPALICLGGCILWAEIRVLYYYFITEERAWLQAVVCAIGTVSMIALDLILIPALGISGAALGYAASLIVTYAASLWVGLRMGLPKNARAYIPGRCDLVDLLSALRGLAARRCSDV